MSTLQTATTAGWVAWMGSVSLLLTFFGKFIGLEVAPAPRSAVFSSGFSDILNYLMEFFAVRVAKSWLLSALKI